MIYKDRDDFPVDQTGDGGDSAMRAGMLALFGRISFGTLYCYRSIYGLRRHPTQYPWNNPENFTRDQLIPLLAGMRTKGMVRQVRTIFWQTVRRGFFGQNTERDRFGSTKYPYPHQFYKDSRPDPNTIPMKWNWKTFRFETTLISNEEHQVEYKLFDCPDFLGSPDIIWHFILCGGIWPLYWFRPVGELALFISIWIHSRSQHKEHNQIIAQCKIAGPKFIRYFKARVPSWEQDLTNYWTSRNETEYASMIIENLRK